ncbi:Methyltransferase-like protein 5 [Ananas comosus]|uniref:Methyltransferase-like protein 5 n=1 Tax=Ananas comosus TaxID=4615 RepID=A0A199V8Q7_ANACO|nr:Methyltransferase-like protein 5 [Ananas comosus]
MKLKHLEGLLGDLQQFSNPKVDLEQYPTGPHIASRMIYMAENSFDDISGKVVADFGCGCGTLGVASSLLGAEHVVGIDIDPQSLEIASQNAEDLEVGINFIWSDIKNLKLRVYSLHKTTTREHIKRTALRDYGAKSAEVLCELRFDVPQLYKFHKKKEVDVAVDLWRFVP